ncbi:hypothetical protein AB1Y20_019366 [Prymnesium parvum]|uniref:Transmembrane protein 107 n=1 Tax=Prymnesium parvum TaxID=97485 RepID=A0AB34JU74_PRYPA|mmetsp:Transcript_2730/g.5730  ORF Transcript_2730/g.5730 Transcript_2730/m.5730 type:complete len:89 (-) Transcript_2730:333-599(-)
MTGAFGGAQSSFVLSLIQELLSQREQFFEVDRLSDPSEERMIEAALHSFSVVAIAGLGLMHAAARLRWPPCSLMLVGLLAFSAPISRA